MFAMLRYISCFLVVLVSVYGTPLDEFLVKLEGPNSDVCNKLCILSTAKDFKLRANNQPRGTDVAKFNTYVSSLSPAIAGILPAYSSDIIKRCRDATKALCMVGQATPPVPTPISIGAVEPKLKVESDCKKLCIDSGAKSLTLEANGNVKPQDMTKFTQVIESHVAYDDIPSTIFVEVIKSCRDQTKAPCVAQVPSPKEISLTDVKTKLKAQDQAYCKKVCVDSGAYMFEVADGKFKQEDMTSFAKHLDNDPELKLISTTIREDVVKACKKVDEAPCTAPDETGDSGSLSAGAVAGIVLGVLALIIVAALLIWYFQFKK